jgi:hypothetical protein
VRLAGAAVADRDDVLAAGDVDASKNLAVSGLM